MYIVGLCTPLTSENTKERRKVPRGEHCDNDGEDRELVDAAVITDNGKNLLRLLVLWAAVLEYRNTVDVLWSLRSSLIMDTLAVPAETRR